MLVTFKDTGMIEEADIRFDGLTVIAGENDTGKSTIGKLMFSIIKTFNRSEAYEGSYLQRNIHNLIEDYYLTLRKKSSETAVTEIKHLFDALKDDIMHIVDEKKSESKIKSGIADLIGNFTETVRKISGVEIGLEDIPVQIANLIKREKSKKDIFRTSFEDLIVSVFNDEIANRSSKEGRYLITGKEGKNNIFEILGANGSIDVRLNDRLYFEDATFIASPILLSLSDNIRFAKTVLDVEGDSRKKLKLLRSGYVPEYMKDFILKVTDRTLKERSPKVIEKIQAIIKGDFYYDHIKEDFIFRKGNESFKCLSIASGVEYLGIVIILLQTGFLNKKSLLILDEPETHIHPQWQIKFAELLVELAVEGNSILLTSHSPYFIEAVKIYSDLHKLGDKTAFYLTEKIKAGFTSNIIEVTHDISPIFELLAEPYEKLEDLQSLEDEDE